MRFGASLFIYPVSRAYWHTTHSPRLTDCGRDGGGGCGGDGYRVSRMSARGGGDGGGGLWGDGYDGDRTCARWWVTEAGAAEAAAMAFAPG